MRFSYSKVAVKRWKCQNGKDRKERYAIKYIYVYKLTKIHQTSTVRYRFYNWSKSWCTLSHCANILRSCVFHSVELLMTMMKSENSREKIFSYRISYLYVCAIEYPWSMLKTREQYASWVTATEYGNWRRRASIDGISYVGFNTNNL